jgi:hypothetical protein
MLRFGRTVESLAVLALTLGAACGDATGLDRLAIAVAVSPDRIAPGEAATIVVRWTNTSFSAVELPGYCMHAYQIANAQGEVVVGHEPIFCALDLRAPEVLEPFQSIERQYTWNGYRMRQDGSNWVSEPAPAGLYRVYAVLEGKSSAPATIEVLP